MLLCCLSQVAAGLGHCLGVTSKGDVVAWGWNAAGQLGLGPSQKEQVVYSPSQVCIPACVHEVQVSPLCEALCYCLVQTLPEGASQFLPYSDESSLCLLRDACKIQHFTMKAPQNQRNPLSMQTNQSCLCAFLLLPATIAMIACSVSTLLGQHRLFHAQHVDYISAKASVCTQLCSIHHVSKSDIQEWYGWACQYRPTVLWRCVAVTDVFVNASDLCRPRLAWHYRKLSITET